MFASQTEKRLISKSSLSSKNKDLKLAGISRLSLIEVMIKNSDVIRNEVTHKYITQFISHTHLFVILTNHMRVLKRVITGASRLQDLDLTLK